MTTIKQLKYSIKNQDNHINSILLSFKINDNKNKQMYLVHRALRQQLTNYRIRNAHTKNKSEVKGGGKKPWKQKGTGKARAGSNRSPLWKGGGIIFGPKKKIYTSKLNKKEKKLAVNTILCNKYLNTVITNQIAIKLNKPSIKLGIAELDKIGINVKNYKNILIIINKKTSILNLSFKNLVNTQLIEVKSINILSLLKADIIIITTSALEKISK
uniref:Large ribosomal subunit protein uL4c n=1 Tax=Harveyella mirabilis TaxID=282355 RepID=A0A3S8UVZ3_9FLOR|nr:ribosomal protein L4 [Harveyella mirabilis]